MESPPWLQDAAASPAPRPPAIDVEEPLSSPEPSPDAARGRKFSAAVLPWLQLGPAATSRPAALDVEELLSSPEPSPDTARGHNFSPARSCDVCGGLYAGPVCRCAQLAMAHPITKILARAASGSGGVARALARGSPPRHGVGDEGASSCVDDFDELNV